MGKIKKLKNLLEKEVLVELNSEIEALEKIILKKKSNELQTELNYLKDVEKFYNEALTMIKQDTLSEEEANNILLDLDDMLVEDEI